MAMENETQTPANWKPACCENVRVPASTAPYKKGWSSTAAATAAHTPANTAGIPCKLCTPQVS